MWTLVVLWLVGTSVTTQAIPGFESQQACGAAFNDLHTGVTWGANVNFVGKCVSLKGETAK
jgi:hypothetical protein